MEQKLTQPISQDVLITELLENYKSLEERVKQLETDMEKAWESFELRE